MVRSIDHIVIAVRDLAQTSQDYRDAGFTVTPGGEHTGGATHNALISFGDGAYFELIAFKEPDRPQEHRWWSQLAAGEGLVDVALLSDGLAQESERLSGTGIEVNGPRDGGRIRPDGQQVAWKTLGLPRTAVPLPFVIEDVTPRELRVPNGTATEHPLGVTRVVGLTIAVENLDESALAFAKLVGNNGITSQPEIEGVREARRFSLGDQWLELAQPDDSASDLRQHLAARGQGPYEIVLGGVDAASNDLLPVSTTHGARIRVTP
ncbi:MAG: VOC family protein [Thermomicrobiales bacterium]